MGVMQKTKEVLRVFIWRFTNKKDKDSFELFQRLAAVDGKRPDELLMIFVRNYVAHNKLTFTPLGEQAMLEEIRKKFKTTRQQLKRFRDEGALEGMWYTDGKAIVYNKEAVMKFIKDREAARKKGGRKS